jgi:hypothetical protein
MALRKMSSRAAVIASFPHRIIVVKAYTGMSFIITYRFILFYSIIYEILNINLFATIRIEKDQRELLDCSSLKYAKYTLNDMLYN